MDKEFLAQEAKRLRDDPVFKETLSRIRDAAIARLINTNADDKVNIITLQQIAKICDLFPNELEAMIQSGQKHEPFKVAV